MSRKGGTGGGGLVHPESESSMAMYGLAVKSLSMAISLILSAIVTYRKQSFYLVGPPCSVQGRFHLPEQLTMNVLGQLVILRAVCNWSRKAILHSSCLVFIVLIMYSWSW